MSLVPEASRLMTAAFLGTVASPILLEIGLRTKSRRAWAIVTCCAAAFFGWETWACTQYVRLIHADYLASTERLIGPSEWQQVWMQAEAFVFTAVLPALVLRALIARRHHLAE